MKLYKAFALFTTLMLLVSSVNVLPAGAAPAFDSVSVRQVSPGVSVKPGTATFTQWVPGSGYTVEVQGSGGGGAKAAVRQTPHANRSFARDQSIRSEKNPVKDFSPSESDRALKMSFEGLNFFQQRWAAGGNQWSVEPPDQGLCASSNYVIEAVNDVVNIFDAHTGQSVMPANNVGGAVDLNTFYGYPVAIDRSLGVFGPSLTDPSCVFDAASGRFFMIVLTFDIDPASGGYYLTNHIDLAVSSTSNPTDNWYVYKLDVTNDGYNPLSGNQCPCLGDYPHLGVDANGVYVSTNAYPWSGSGFDGAQIYAFAKSQLVAASTVNVVAINTWDMVNAPSDAGSKQPGFTVWPAQAPDGQYNSADGGTEYFVSSNAADEATHPLVGSGGTYTSSKLVVWTLKNTSALSTNHPQDVNISNKLIGVNPYSLPPKAKQNGTGGKTNTNSPLGYCINNTNTKLNASIFGAGARGCWQVLGDSGPSPVQELISYLDSNDTRIQQVTLANGYLWTTLDSAVTPKGSSVPRSGIEWFMIKPDPAAATKQGFLGAKGMDFTYPAIGVTSAGKGVITFTATGDSAYPGAAYASLDGNHGVTDWAYAKAGAAVQDGFSGYVDVNGAPIRPRWGDYGAAAVVGDKIWIASEYIASACDYKTWGGSSFDNGVGQTGVCGGTRAFYGNWSTRISQIKP